MELLISYLLIVHIASGSIALLSAPIAMVTQKGGTQHRLWGKVYFWGMTVAISLSTIIAIYKTNYFLLMVGIFSYYFIATGYRALYLKKLFLNQKPSALDWLIKAITGIASFLLMLLGIFVLFKSEVKTFGYIAIPFGLVGIFSVINDTIGFLRPSKTKNEWFFNHMIGMLGGYIATLTAVSVTNFTFMPTVVRWLWPAFIGIPLINLWVRYYRKKLLGGKKASELVTVKINPE